MPNPPPEPTPEVVAPTGSERTYRPGYDVPETDISKDLLNRRPLARKIYSICSNTAPEWSVRIGVYGEWGTGKSSVLRFVETMALADGHLVCWFNPWEFTTKEDLWKAFVLQIFRDLETKIGTPTDAGSKAIKKSRIDNVARIAGHIVGAVNESAGKAIGGTLDLVKKAFTLTEEDRGEIDRVLGGKRVMVIIDDLDRTASELVPGILYAIKEILDVPGFTFVCAFDPVIVGKVLGQQNEGFGDGLKFLEKIIDYPVWLPAPTPAGLANIALATAAHHCPFVPRSEIQSAIELLPQNPRSIKQFARLLALLRTEIERYEPQELKWPVIVSAAVLNVQYPRLAPLLLGDHSFWDQVQTEKLMGDNRKRGGEELIAEHIKASVLKAGSTVTAAESEQIALALTRMTGMIDLWLGVSRAELKASASITDDPVAVTWKECFTCITDCAPDYNQAAIAKWVGARSDLGSHSRSEILGELTLKLLKLFLINLRQADGGFSKAEQREGRAEAEKIFALIRVICLESSSLDEADPLLKWLPLEKLFEDLPALIEAVGGGHARMWPRVRTMLDGIVAGFPDIDRLLEILSPWRSWFRTRQPRQKSREVYLHLAEVMNRRYSSILASKFAEPNIVKNAFYNGDRFPHARNLLVRAGEPFWSTQRTTIIRILKAARTNAVIRGNAYEFLYWLEYLFTNGKDESDAQILPVIASQSGLLKAFWGAATVVPFADSYAHRLRKIPEFFRASGVEVKPPKWWNGAISSYHTRLEQSLETTD